MVEHRFREAGVVGSNPITPTIIVFYPAYIRYPAVSKFFEHKSNRSDRQSCLRIVPRKILTCK